MQTVGQTVGGRYALDGRLGEGGMGCVYRARHLQLGKAFALKIISPTFALDSAARERFNQEAKLASEITHPNIVSVVDYGEDPEFGAYMVMELVEGEPLIDGSGPMTVRRACDMLGQIADALDSTSGSRAAAVAPSGAIRTDVVTRESSIVAAFERSRTPQALCTFDGVIVLANKAFVGLCTDDALEGKHIAATSLSAVVTSLPQAFAALRATGKPVERRASTCSRTSKKSAPGKP